MLSMKADPSEAAGFVCAVPAILGKVRLNLGAALPAAVGEDPDHLVLKGLCRGDSSAR